MKRFSSKTFRKMALVILCFLSLRKADAQQTTPWPEWVFYHWIWESESTEQSAKQIINDYQQNNIPVGAIIIDSPWETKYNNFQFDTSLFQDPKGMVDYIHSQNIRVLLWITSFINKDADSLYAYAKSNHYFLQKNAGDDTTLVHWWKGDGSLIDLFNPNAVKWWKGMMDSVLALKIDGWKCDGSDFSAGSVTYSPYLAATITRAAYSDKYYRFFFDSTRAALGNDRVNLVRPVDNYGFDIGGPAVSFAPVDVNFAGWVGDQDPTFTGLKKALNNMYYSSQGNYLAFGSDIGGYRDDYVTYPAFGRSQELFIRWAELGALSAIMENGGDGEHRPWKFDTVGTQTADIYRKFVQLHYHLTPYFAQVAKDSYQANKSMVKFFNKTDYSYMIGSDVFVAPFLASGTSIKVTFPAGTDKWVYIFDTTQVYSGGAVVNNMTVPLDQFPVFIKQGQGDTLLHTILGVTENNALADQVKIYPNPTHGKFSVSILSQTHYTAQLKIFDLTGREVLQLPKANVQEGMNSIDINASSLRSGTYFLWVSIPSGQINAGHKIQTKRLIKID